MNDLTGTKETIFDVFIELVSEFGYENVSMRDIADKVGIKCASIYGHFESKQSILELVYEYYAGNFRYNLLPVAEAKKIVAEGTVEDVINALNLTWETEDQKKYVRMILITKIKYMRIFQDKLASSLFSYLNSDMSKYVVEVLQHGVLTGRLDPEFDIEIFAELIIGAKAFMGVRAFTSPQYEVGQIASEERIMAMLERLLATAFLDKEG